MSAIAGILFHDGKPANRPQLESMLAAIRHRETAHAATWAHGSAALGGSSISTSDQWRRGFFPAQPASAELAIVADARIDNREALLIALEIASPRWAAISDAELILRAYGRWGEDCPGRLLGDFAFVIWDRPRRTLFCARDHFGVKPFYYCSSHSGFFFASEIKGLLSLAEVPSRLNPDWIARYLTLDMEDSASTAYAGIFRLPPAHHLTLAYGRPYLSRFWSLDSGSELRRRSDEEYALEFRGLFTEAVRVRLRGTAPCGALLSGGLDSSSIVCTARSLLANVLPKGAHEPLKTFSAVSPGSGAADESIYMNAVLDGGDLDAHFVKTNTLHPLGHLDRVLACQDQPYCGPNLYIHWALYEAAHARGVRVLLDGLDGDTTVSHGFGLLPELLRGGRWISLAREIRALSLRFERPQWHFMKEKTLRPLFSNTAAQFGWKRRRGILRDELARGVAGKFAGRQPHPPLSENSRGERGDHCRRLNRGLIVHCLEMADHAATAFGIEPRYPFFDKRLVEYCLALPPEQKIANGWTRLVMRRAMAGILPPQVQWRGGKSDLGVNFLPALLASEPRPLDKLFNDAEVRVWAFADRSKARGLYDHATSGGGGARKNEVVLWQLCVLEAWLKRRDSEQRPAELAVPNRGEIADPVFHSVAV